MMQLPRDEILSGLGSLTGVVQADPLNSRHCLQLYEIELEAEKKAFMGIGRVFNSGIRDVLSSPLVIVCFTNTDYNWGCHSNMVLKKGDEVVGEEVYDPRVIRAMEKRSDIWFLHRNFAVYKGKVNFPRDVTEKRCFFEYPAIYPEPGELAGLPDTFEYSFTHATVPGDQYLKKSLYDGKDEPGLGTVLFGIRFPE